MKQDPPGGEAPGEQRGQRPGPVRADGAQPAAHLPEDRERRREVRRMARAAWIGVALAPMGAAIGLISGSMAYSVVGGAPAGGAASAWQAIVVALACAVPLLAAPVVGLRFGIRAARAGSTPGLMAALVSALILGMLTLWLLVGVTALV